MRGRRIDLVQRQLDELEVQARAIGQRVADDIEQAESVVWAEVCAHGCLRRAMRAEERAPRCTGRTAPLEPLPVLPERVFDALAALRRIVSDDKKAWMARVERIGRRVLDCRNPGEPEAVAALMEAARKAR